MTRLGKWLLILVVSIAALVVLILLLPKSSTIDPAKLTVQTVSVERLDGDLLKVILCLSNDNQNAVQVQEDFQGQPALTRETIGHTEFVTRIAKNSALELAPKQTLTTTAVVSNPPSRFRLLFSVRDLDAQQEVFKVRRLLPGTLAGKYTEWHRGAWNPANPPSDWIEVRESAVLHSETVP